MNHKMQIKNFCILQVLQHNESTILCHINIKPRSIRYYHGQEQAHETYHWMQPEHWASFEAKLEELLDGGLDKLKEETYDQQFCLNPLLNVHVRSAHTPPRKLCRCAQLEGDEPLKTKDVALGLECVIEYRAEGKYPSAENAGEGKRHQESDELIIFETDDIEYDPQQGASHIPYVPYTPSPNGAKSKAAETDIRIDEEPYSPKPISEEVITESPLYTAKPIGKKQKKLNHSSDESDVLTVTNDQHKGEVKKLKKKKFQDAPKIVEELEKEAAFEGEEEKSKKKKGHSSEFPEDPVERQKEVELEFNIKKSRNKRLDGHSGRESAEKEENGKELEGEEYGKKKHKHHKRLEENELEVINVSDSSPAEKGLRGKESDDLTSSAEKLKPKVRNINTERITAAIRRSSRSPNKPARLLDGIVESVLKRGSKNKSPGRKKTKETDDKTKQLFGSDDDDFQEPVQKTPLSKKAPTLVGSDSTKKRKRNLAKDCEQEKTGMSEWLGKKGDDNEPPATLKPNDKAKTLKKRKRGRENSPLSTIKPAIKMPTAEEIREQMRKDKNDAEYFRELNKKLKVLAGPDPEETDTLNLHGMDVKQLLNTFEKYESNLNEIFQKLCKKPNVGGNNGIDHCTIIRLIEDRKQLAMLDKLGEMYDPDEGSSAYAKLFTNAMLPEWILGLFMDKYKFTREEALAQVRKQEDYKLYLEAKSNDSLTLDYSM